MTQEYNTSILMSTQYCYRNTRGAIRFRLMARAARAADCYLLVGDWQVAQKQVRVRSSSPKPLASSHNLELSRAE